MESPGLSAVVADTAQSAEFIVCRPAEGAGQSKSRLCSKSCARSPRKYFLFLLSPCGGDDLLVDHVPTNVAISLRRDEPYAMHTALPKPAAIVKQRGQSSVTDRLGVSSALGWLQGLVSAERDGYYEVQLIRVEPVTFCNHERHEIHQRIEVTLTHAYSSRVSCTSWLTNTHDMASVQRHDYVCLKRLSPASSG